MLVGRGRGHVSTDRREQLRRPIDKKYVNSMDHIASKIAVLKLDSQEELESIQDDFTKYCTSIEKLKLLINDLHERSLAKRPFGAKCAVALATQSQLTVDNMKLRAVLMQNLQNDFVEKENLRHHNPSRFMNMVAFLGEIFQNVLLADKTPILVLADALIEYCKILIVGSELEVELAVQQLAYNGRLLNKWKAVPLRELQMSIRSASMVPGIDARRLGWLQLACDLGSSNYISFSNEFRSWYEQILGSETMTTVTHLLSMPDPAVFKEVVDEQLALNSLSIAPTAAPEPTGLLDISTDRFNGCNFRSELPQPESLEPRTSHKPDSDSPSNPASNSLSNSHNRLSNSCKKISSPKDCVSSRRNYSERKNDPRNDPANWLPRNEPIPDEDLGIWGSTQSKQSSWGHDDRFQKDDNFYANQEPHNKTNVANRNERLRAAMGTKEGNRYGQRKFDEAASQPLPCRPTDNEEAWD